MRRKLLLGALLLGVGPLALGTPLEARAGSAKPAKKKPGKKVEPVEAPPEDTSPEAAQLHHDVGQEHYEAGHYQKALGEFEAADRIKSTPARKMMVARCLEKLGRVPEALELYKVVAARSPDPFDADEAKRRIKELTPKPTAAEMGADPFAEPPPPPDDKKAEESPPPDEAPPPKGNAKRPAKSGGKSR